MNETPNSHVFINDYWLERMPSNVNSQIIVLEVGACVQIYTNSVNPIYLQYVWCKLMKTLDIEWAVSEMWGHVSICDFCLLAKVNKENYYTSLRYCFQFIEGNSECNIVQFMTIYSSKSGI